MLTVVLGGARSGKSRYAQSLCGDRPAVYLATATLDIDPEMQQRIDRHRRSRPCGWTTIEEGLDVPSAVRRAEPSAAPVVVDCVSIWVANLLWTLRDERPADQEEAVLRAADSLSAAAQVRDVIAVSNEVGGGTVPGHAVARLFRDIHGRVNQTLAREARRVVLMVAGLPLVLKEDG